MIDLEKSKLEAEALAKLRKEQYFREVLAGELGVMIDQHFESKEPLVKTIPIFVRAVEDLALTAREILDYLEGVENDRMKLMKELEAKPITAAEEAPSTAAEPEPEKEPTPKEVLDLIASEKKFPDTLVENAKKICGHEEPSTAAVKVSNERIEQLRSEGLSVTQIAKLTGMKPNTVTRRILYNENKIDRKAKTEKPEATPRVLSKDIIIDTELEEQYFKHGKTVKEIAQKYGIKPDGLYKRIEAMKAQRQDIAKECVSSQQ